MPKRKGRRRLTDASGRDALLDAAMPCFARYGFDGVSLRAIAAEADVDVSLAIHLFGSKADLWEAAVERLALWMAPRLAEIKDRLAHPDRSTDERLREFIDWFVDSRALRPEFGLFLAQEFGRPGPRQETVVEKLIRPLYETIRPTLEEAHREGIVDAPDPAVFFFMLACGISLPLAGRTVIERLSHAEPNGDALVADIKRTALSLVRPNRADSRPS